MKKTEEQTKQVYTVNIHLHVDIIATDTDKAISRAEELANKIEGSVVKNVMVVCAKAKQ